MPISSKSRRGVLAGLAAAIAGLFAFRAVSASGGTPSAAEGPFYPTPKMRFTDADNNLIKIAGLVEEAGGEPITLKGKITDAKGTPRPGLRIEIWQCDMNGNSLHTGDDRSVNHDPAFQGFGHDITTTDGSYTFHTIKPARYPGRTPHIHIKVLDGENELLTTQFYIKDHPDNAGDGLFGWMSKDQQKLVEMVFAEGSDGVEAVVDVIV